ncbi:MAG: hypothetical protein HUJ57_08395 [Erysipelotrichaceae bacterium]|nr:hypothetical protein [Erysipelotrichaceae bacterium]
MSKNSFALHIVSAIIMAILAIFMFINGKTLFGVLFVGGMILNIASAVVFYRINQTMKDIDKN